MKKLFIILAAFLAFSTAHAAENNALALAKGENTQCTKSLIEYGGTNFIIGAAHSHRTCDKTITFQNGSTAEPEYIARGDLANIPWAHRGDWALYRIKSHSGALPTPFQIQKAENIDKIEIQRLKKGTECKNARKNRGNNKINLDFCTVAGDSGAPYLNASGAVIAIHSGRTKDYKNSVASGVDTVLLSILSCSAHAAENASVKCNPWKVSRFGLSKLLGLR